MKVVMLHWAFPPIIGGVESHLAMLGPDLVRLGCKVSLLTNAVNGKEEEYLWKGMKVRRSKLFDLNSLDPVTLKQRAREIDREIMAFIQEEKPDLVHAHNMHYFSLEHTDSLFKVKKKWGFPLVLTAHNVWEDKLWREFNQRAHYWDEVIAVSHYIKKELVKSGYVKDRVKVIHHGLDLNTFKTEKYEIAANPLLAELGGRRIIFHPARMSMAKGSHISLQALKQIKQHFPEVLLVMAGTEKTVDWGSHQNKEVNQLKNMILELGLQDNVHIQFFPWEEMPLAYQAAEICIYPSCFEEPFGLVMLESMAMARPIVVSRAGGMPEIIQEGVNGFIVPMNDPRALAERCCELLRNPLLAQKIGQNGHKIVHKTYTKELMNARTLFVYGEALSGRLRQQRRSDEKVIA